MSLILGEQDEQRLAPFIQAGTAQHKGLQRWAKERGLGSVSSEAAIIRALLQAGVDSCGDDLLDEGYAEPAQFYDGATEHAERRVARDRYVDQTEATL